MPDRYWDGDLSPRKDSSYDVGEDGLRFAHGFFDDVQTIKGADIASATTTDIGAATGNFIDVTGTTTITGLGTVTAGTQRWVRFAGALTLTHNATSLILPGAANITTAANDRACFVSLGSGNWLCLAYQPADGVLIGGSATAAEVDRVADVSARLVAAGGTLSVTEASHDGKTILLDTASGSVATLPSASGSGAIFRFVVSTTVTSNDHIVQVAASTDDEFNGHMIQTDTDTSDTLVSYPALAADNFDTITMNGTTKGGLVGDEIIVQDIASGLWSVKGHINANGSVATPFSSDITS